MKKAIKKISKAIIAIMLLIVIDVSLVANCVQASNTIEENIYQIDYCEKVLKYKGIPRGAAYVVYKKGTVEYPAYCINPERIGVGETDAYNVDVNGYITDVILWRIIINGYPYKQPLELGVANAKEAYLATKQAIYCYLDNRDVNAYTGIGEAGERTLNALKQIWRNAMNSKETKISNVVDIIPVNSEWKQDEINPKYISKTYNIETSAPISASHITIKGEGLPEGIIVADENNNPSEVVISSEPFKVLIPIDQLKKDGSFEIGLEAQVYTKPVLYGVSKNSELQNYALTAFKYEDGAGSYIEQYKKSEAQINILKREKETKKPLEGVEFQLLNSNKEPIHQSLITDSKGQITLENVVPGTYYLREIRTLEGYVPYDEDIKIEVNLNEKVNVIVNNSKEKNIEITKEESNIEVSKTEESIKGKEEQLNISKETNVLNINKEAKELNIDKETNVLNITKENNTTNIKETTNIKRLPKTGM